MELRRYIFIFLKWLWLFLIGALAGGAVAYVSSLFQPLVYETTTKVLVSRAPDDRSADYAFTTGSDFQLARTYSQLIVTEPVLELVEQELGISLSVDQFSVRQIADSQILEITVRDGDQERVALIANSLISIFIDYNEELQTSRYASSEASLLAQINQVEEQISSLENEVSAISQASLENQLNEVNSSIAELEGQLVPIDDELARLATDLASLNNQIAQVESLSSRQTASLLQLQSAISDQEKERDEIQSTLDIYKEILVNLQVYGQVEPDGGQGTRQDQLQSNLGLYQQIYSNLLNNYESIRLARLRSTPNVIQIEIAKVPIKSIQPKPLQNTLLGITSGLLVMGGIVFLIEYLDDTLKTPEDVARELNLPVIGLIGEIEIPKNSKTDVFVADHPRSPVSEAFRTLRTNLDFAGIDKPIKTLLVTSPGPSEGKSTMVVNLATTMAQGSQKVMLVDADLRRPSIHRYLKVSNRFGLTDLLRDPKEEKSIVKHWGPAEFDVITTGKLPPNPAELLRSDRMKQILGILNNAYDVILLDSPPAIVSDPIVLSTQVDGVLLIIGPGKTRADAARAMIEQLYRVDANIVGVVLNPIMRNRANYYGKYQYSTEYYTEGYGYDTELQSSRRRAFRKNLKWPFQYPKMNPEDEISN